MADCPRGVGQCSANGRRHIRTCCTCPLSWVCACVDPCTSIRLIAPTHIFALTSLICPRSFSGLHCPWSLWFATMLSRPSPVLLLVITYAFLISPVLERVPAYSPRICDMLGLPCAYVVLTNALPLSWCPRILAPVICIFDLVIIQSLPLRHIRTCSHA